jgi:hypothetical protein
VHRAASLLTTALNCLQPAGRAGGSTCQTSCESSALSLSVTRPASAGEQSTPMGGGAVPGATASSGACPRSTETAWLRLDDTWPRRWLVERTTRRAELVPEATNPQRVRDGPQSGPTSPRRGMGHPASGIASRPARNRANEHSMLDRPPDRRRAKAGDDAGHADVLAGPEDQLAARVAQECAEQGIPVAIDDPVTIAKIMTLMRDGRVSTSATKAAKSARRGRPSSSAKGR